MAWSFGRGSGPGSNQAPNPYLHHRPQPPPPFQTPPSDRNFEASQSIYSPPFPFQSNYSVGNPSCPPAAITRSFGPQTHQRPSTATPSLPSKHQRAHFPTKTAPLDYLKRARPSQLQSADEHSVRNSRRTDPRHAAIVDGPLQSVSQKTSPPFITGNHYSRESIGPFVDFQRQRPPGPLFDDDIQPEPQKTRSPPSFTGTYSSAENVGHFTELQRPAGATFNNHMQSGLQRTRSPPRFPGNNRAGQKATPSFEPPRPPLSSSIRGYQARPTSDFSNTWFNSDQSPHKHKRQVSVTHVSPHAPKQIKSPPVPSANVNDHAKSHFSQHGSLRPSVSPPGSRTRSIDLNNLSEYRGFEIPHMFPSSARDINNDNGAIKNINFPASKRSPSFVYDAAFQRDSFAHDNSEGPSVSPPGFVNRTNNSNDAYQSPDIGIPPMSVPSRQSNENNSFVNKPTNVPAPKRNRSPPLISGDGVFQGNFSPQDDSEREIQAKAKRLARFKVELSQPVESTSAIVNQMPLPGTRNTVGTLSANMEEDFDETVPDQEGPKSTTVIIGLCPDMCPVSEREERERKGDLDKYERLDGDRNQTNKSLAVKKYNRTAEREASLIRPMPVLKKTIDYLLYLLDQPYDDKFLGLYNFLWDRMRAIRMDLRMQHIFNVDSITMLEQMIRLHIIAMHELCEYTKGEGFSEGFDAHLNIEQMNKTSVELFQLYDDHRKKGINVPTEKEFRGYYALLKLDKHPGYKVEPAELSHDLSKMTPEIRTTREVLFARDVARACRTGNFITFFRLARKASYLQACLMHAHFAKLRTQALASLHSGLQSNQGIPVALVAKWLAMEGEDIESLLEYHGFLIRDFDEPYMVKDGQFLNSDNDFPLKCSELVHVKKAEMISEDVSSSISTASASNVDTKKDPIIISGQPKPVFYANMEDPILPVNEVMNDNEVVPSPKSSTQVYPFMKTSSFGRQSEKKDQMPQVSSPSWGFSPAVSTPKSPQASAPSIGKSPFSSGFRNSLERKSPVNSEAIPMQVMVETVNQDQHESPRNDFTTDKMVAEGIIEDKQHMEINYQDVEPEEVDPDYDEEVAEARLRLIFRIWRRHSLRRKELREQRQLAAVAALNSLSLGPPVQHRILQPGSSSMLNIDLIANERYKRHGKSWSSLNVSEVLADALSRRTLSSKCFCWKMILSSQSQNSDSVAISWLRSKLMPMKKDNEFDLITSSPDLSIWKKWITDKNGDAPICYLSIIKEAEFDNLRETMLGTCAVSFLISEGSSLEIEKLRLHKILSSLPSDSHIPVLIIADSYERDSSSSIKIADQLELNNIDKSLVSDYSVIFLKNEQDSEDFGGYLNDEGLRRGLKWLANHSPFPPDVSCVKSRDLVEAHLSSSMHVLDEIGAYEVGPDHCVSAFNEALNQTIANIYNAASANFCAWPCPEIDLVDKTSDEYEMVTLYLPVKGWSSPDRIDQLVSALRGTKLPLFEDDFSWLYKGSNSRKEIENQKQLLENCLIKYLVETSKMMGLSLATNEAFVMLQKCSRLELHGSTYYIIPMWVQIFRRIFNWRLTAVSTGVNSTAYIFEHDKSALWMKNLDVEDKSSPHGLIVPSLDEMINGCTEIEAFEPSPLTVAHGSKALKCTDFGGSVIGKLNFDVDDVLEETNFIDQRSDETTDERVVGSELREETGRLSKLLEHCNILQDNIDKKLSIYF